jgi:hypothetical protein
MAGSLKVFLEGSGVLNRFEYSFYIDGPPPGPLLYCTRAVFIFNEPALRGPRTSCWLLRNLSNHMDRQARAGDTV